MKYLKQTFDARAYPSAIFIPTRRTDLPEFVAGLSVEPIVTDECIAGPFCLHCGNPLSLHDPKLRCPNRHLHPLFPPPRLPFREEAR